MRSRFRKAAKLAARAERLAENPKRLAKAQKMMRRILGSLRGLDGAIERAGRRRRRPLPAACTQSLQVLLEDARAGAAARRAGARLSRRSA
jgi:hypothetical protein